MIAEVVMTVWVIVALISGTPPPIARVFPDEATCRSTLAKLEAEMALDGDKDGDAVSACIKVEIKRPPSGPSA